MGRDWRGDPLYFGEFVYYTDAGFVKRSDIEDFMDDTFDKGYIEDFLEE